MSLQLEAVVNPSSSSQQVTWTSSEPGVASVSAGGLLEARQAGGSTTITATSVEDPGFSDSFEVSVFCPDPRVVSNGLITSDVTWENWIADPGCVDYHVTGNVNNQADALLTIEPGTWVMFSANRSMVIRGQGGLSAAGTEDDPIFITGPQFDEVIEPWNGVFLDDTTHPENRIEHVVFDGAGSGSWSGSLPRANLMIDGETTLVNSTFSRSAEWGLTLTANAVLREYGNNTFVMNGFGPVHTIAWHAHYIDETSVIFDNEDDRVTVDANVITDEVTWAAVGSGFRILKEANEYAFTVGAGGHLTLQPGVRIDFDNDMGMTVSAGGALTAVGTEDKPIVLTSDVPTQAYWRGLRIFSADSDNRLEHVVIENGGSDTHSGSVEPGNLFLAVDAAITIQSTTFRFGLGYGLVASNGASLPAFTGNSLSGNALGPAYVYARVAGDLLASNSYTGNGHDGIMVQSYPHAIVTNATWEGLAVPYIIVEAGGAGLNVMEASLTLMPGVTVLFQGGMGLSFTRATFTSQGTQEDPVSLAGDGVSWPGVLLHQSAGTVGHTTISDAGSAPWPTLTDPGAISITTAGGLSSTISLLEGASQSGAEFGLVFGSGATLGSQCSRMGPISVPILDQIVDHCP